MANVNTTSNVVNIWSDDDNALRDLLRITAAEAAVPEAAGAIPEHRSEPSAQSNFHDELQPGASLLKGQYVITSFLNSGGFGITYLAKDSLDRTVVIKECFPNALCRRNGSDVNARSRAQEREFGSVVRLFVQEARSLSKLAHPNIVGVHQVFEDNNTAYMAIDYINGQDLLDIVDGTDEPFTPAEVVQLLKKILHAVAFVHKSGMLHRDISPDNILVDGDQNPVLIDFGAAREQATKASRALSTRRVVKDGYSPQEFYLSGAAQGPWSDLYALAATFYHVINGAAPVESQRRLAAIAEGDDDPYEPLTDCYEGYPPGFLEAIDQAAKVLPKDRIATADDWLEVIEAGEIALANAPPEAAAVVLEPEPEAIAADHPYETYHRAAAARRTRILTERDAMRPAARPSRGPYLYGSAAFTALVLGAGVWFFGSDAIDAERTTPAITAALSAVADTPGALMMTAGSGAADVPTEATPAGLATPEVTESGGVADFAAAPPEAVVEAPVAVTPVVLAAPAAGSAGPVLARQILSTTWDYSLPFNTELHVVEGKSVAVISSVDASDPATLIAANIWMVPGAQIYAINGTWVTGVGAIRDLLRSGATPDALGQMSLTARIRAPFDSADAQVSLVVPASLRMELLNGTVLVSRAEGGQWRTIVESVTDSGADGLLPGDIILAEQSLRMAVDSADSVEVMIDFLAFKNVAFAVFDVFRAGVLVSVSMPLSSQ